MQQFEFCVDFETGDSCFCLWEWDGEDWILVFTDCGPEDPNGPGDPGDDPGDPTNPGKAPEEPAEEEEAEEEESLGDEEVEDTKPVEELDPP